MDCPFYKSDYLGRVVYFTEIEGLTASEVASLKVELRVAVSNMKRKHAQEATSGDPDWLYAISLKTEICEEFLARIDEITDVDAEAKLNHYHLLCLRQEISNAMGTKQAREMFDRSRKAAASHLRKESES